MPRRIVSTRSALRGAARWATASLAYAVAFLGATAIAAAADREVRIYNWTDYIAPKTLERFTAETGIRTVYDMYDGNETLEAKLLAGRSGYDLVFPSARPYLARQLQAGVHQPLDKSKLTNLGNLDPQILKSLEDVDPGNKFGVPYLWGTTGIGYNVAKVTAAVGDAPKDGWQLLLDPDSAKKLAGCGISMLDDATEAVSAALAYLGRDPNSVAKEDLEAAGAALKKIRPYIRYFHSSKYINGLANGEICIAHGYSGDVAQARARAAEAKRNVEIAYIIPKQGAPLATDVAVIPKDAPHPAEAHAFLDFLMKPDVIAEVTNATFYPNANQAATKLVDPKIANDPGIYPQGAAKDSLFVLKVQPDRERRAIERLWTQVKSGR